MLHTQGGDEDSRTHKVVVRRLCTAGRSGVGISKSIPSNEWIFFSCRSKDIDQDAARPLLPAHHNTLHTHPSKHGVVLRSQKRPQTLSPNRPPQTNVIPCRSKKMDGEPAARRFLIHSTTRPEYSHTHRSSAAARSVKQVAVLSTSSNE